MGRTPCLKRRSGMSCKWLVSLARIIHLTETFSPWLLWVTPRFSSHILTKYPYTQVFDGHFSDKSMAPLSRIHPTPLVSSRPIPSRAQAARAGHARSQRLDRRAPLERFFSSCFLFFNGSTGPKVEWTYQTLRRFQGRVGLFSRLFLEGTHVAVGQK